MLGNRRSEKAMKQFLLGTAPEQDSRALEDLYFQDAEIFDRLLEIDDALLDGYLDDTLTSDERHAFERSLETHPGRRQRLLLVRNLAAKASKESVAVPRSLPRVELPTGVVQSWSGMGAWRWGLAAALLVLAVSGGWLIREVMRLQGDLQQAGGTQAALRRDASTLREELTRERERAAQLAAGDGVAGGGGQVTPAMTGIVALTLTPGLRREGSLPTVMVSPQTLLVRVELLLTTAQFRRYRAVLETAAGGERWTQTDLAPTRIGSRDAIRIDIPASILSGGQLALTLQGVQEDRGPVLVDEYHFRVADR
jgi:anti-sigma factor RsiW